MVVSLTARRHSNRHQPATVSWLSLYPPGGTRIATSDSIEALMEEDFELVINDDVYHVKTPELERPSQVRWRDGVTG